MKKIWLFSLALVASIYLAGQSYTPPNVRMDTLPDYPLRVHAQDAFRVGEKLTYRIHYGIIDAGEAVLEVKNSPYTFDNRQAYHIVGTGRSLGAFDWVFKVRDRYETYIDKQGIFPYRFIRDVNEGGYEIYQDYTFHQKKRAVRTHENNEFLLPEFTQDMISAFYYARTLDFSEAQPGDVFTIMTFVDNEVFPLKIKYQGKEQIDLRSGTYKCLRFVPVIQEGRIFKDEDDMHVWITDDPNHIPILVKSKILVGSIKMELTNYNGLAHPIAKVD